jgi:hypothetical protein
MKNSTARCNLFRANQWLGVSRTCMCRCWPILLHILEYIKIHVSGALLIVCTLNIAVICTCQLMLGISYSNSHQCHWNAELLKKFAVAFLRSHAILQQLSNFEANRSVRNVINFWVMQEVPSFVSCIAQTHVRNIILHFKKRTVSMKFAVYGMSSMFYAASLINYLHIIKLCTFRHIQFVFLLFRVSFHLARHMETSSDVPVAYCFM